MARLKPIFRGGVFLIIRCNQIKYNIANNPVWFWNMNCIGYYTSVDTCEKNVCETGGLTRFSNSRGQRSESLDL